MDDPHLAAVLDDDDDHMSSLNNVMLGMGGASAVGSAASGSSSGSRSGRGGRSRSDDPPPDFVDPREAYSILNGIPPPPSEYDFPESSCDELSDSDDDQDDSDDLLYGGDDADDLFSPRSSKAKSDRTRKRKASGSASAAADERGVPRARSGGGGGDGPGAGSVSGPRNYSRLECWACRFTSRAEPDDTDKAIDVDRVNEMLLIFDTYYGRRNMHAIARAIHVYFKKNIYLPLRAAGKPIKMWRTWEVYIHFTTHTWEPRVLMGEQVEQYRLLSRALFCTTFQRTQGGSLVQPDAGAASMLVRVNTALMSLLRSKPDALMFYDANCTINVQNLGKGVVPTRDFRTVDRHG